MIALDVDGELRTRIGLCLTFGIKRVALAARFIDGMYQVLGQIIGHTARIQDRRYKG